ncbi:MAG: FAD-binding protein [Caldilineaceae bacterium]
MYTSNTVHQPESVEQLQEIVARGRRVKVFGSRHSFNAITDSAHEHISLDRMPSHLAIDPAQGTVTVSGGITYGDLCAQLHRAGRAIHNIASLPHITVAGAIATATHGSGDSNGNLATAVTALELVKADGEIVRLSRQTDGETFLGAVVGLGALGIVTQITLQTEPAFEMQQMVYENMPRAQADAHFDDIFASAYSVSFFIDWQQERVNQVWLKHRLPRETGQIPPSTFHGATLATRHLHPVTAMDPAPCTAQMGIPGPWHERLPHFVVNSVPASGNELQTEYFVARRDAVAAMAAITTLRREIEPLLHISEVRSVAADDLWLSTAYGRETVALHFSWKKDWAGLQRLLPVLEERLAPFAPRAHWGKLSTLSPAAIRAGYPRLADFQALCRVYDPQGKFRNAFLDEVLGAV